MAFLLNYMDKRLIIYCIKCGRSIEKYRIDPYGVYEMKCLVCDLEFSFKIPDIRELLLFTELYIDKQNWLFEDNNKVLEVFCPFCGPKKDGGGIQKMKQAKKIDENGLTLSFECENKLCGTSFLIIDND